MRQPLLRCRLIKLIQKIFSQPFICIVVLIPDFDPVDLVRAQTEIARACDNDFICVEQLLKAEGLFLIRNAQSGAGAKKVSAGYAGQDKIIRRGGVENAVFQNVNVAVCAFCDTPARTIEDSLGAAVLRRLLRCHHRGNEIECLNIAVEEPSPPR